MFFGLFCIISVKELLRASLLLVYSSTMPELNWDIGHYDFLVIDELSMVPTQIFDHIMKTLQQLHIRPVVLLCGDQQQQQPFKTVADTTRPTQGVLQDKNLYKNSVLVNFLQQHRCNDPEFQEFLNVIRYFKPSMRTLNRLQNGRVICDHDPSDRDIYNALVNMPYAAFLTVSRAAANRVNTVATVNLFQDQEPLGTIAYDNDNGPRPVFLNIITQNRDKEIGIVNGRKAKVVAMHNTSLFLQLDNNRTVAIYPITEKIDGISRTVYPITPAYASTICKVQGQTLGKMILWLDCPVVPCGTAYVALSRIRTLENLHFFTKTNPDQFKPVEHFAV